MLFERDIKKGGSDDNLEKYKKHNTLNKSIVTRCKDEIKIGWQRIYSVFGKMKIVQMDPKSLAPR